MYRQISFSVRTIFISLFFIFSASTQAAEYYVSTTGNDANPGTISSPWRTIKKAATTMAAGDTTYVRGGTYNEYSITFSNSGTNGNPITLQGYPGETAIIDGGFTSDNGRNPVFDIDNRNYITLDGLTIKRGSTANVYISYNNASTNITIRNSDISDFVSKDNSGQIYVNVRSDNIVIENNKLHGAQGTGGIPAGIMIFRTGALRINNNEIYSNNTTGGQGGTGIMYKHGGEDGKVTHIYNNLIYGHTRWGVLLNRADVVFENNIIRDTPLGLLVFEESGSCDVVVAARAKILHNTIVNVGKGIQLDRSTSCPGAVDTVVRNNLIYNFTNTELRGLSIWPYYSGSDASRTTVEYNLIYSTVSSQALRDLTSYYSIDNPPATVLGDPSKAIKSAPIFVNYSGNNFTLQSGPGKNGASDGADIGANTHTVGVNIRRPMAITDLK